MSNKTRYALDTEFLEDGRTIELISIALVCEDGREYYAVNWDAPWDEIHENTWLCKNVVPSLPLRGGIARSAFNMGRYSFTVDRSSVLVKPKWVIANEVREFLVGDLKPAGENDGRPFYFDTDLPELWADYAAYDHVAMAQLWGRMIDLPTGIPMFTHDLQQALELNPGFEPSQQEDGLHNALDDARHVMRVLKELDDFHA
jgi:hypothetical protein